MSIALDRSIDILFLIGCWEGESKRYRVYNIAEGLNSLGYNTEVMDFSRSGDIVDRNICPKVIVIFRSPFDPSKRVVELLEYCRIHRIDTVFDIDDYVFEPSIIDSIAGVAVLDADQRRDYEWGVRAYRSLLFSCGKATTTTPFLAERMRELGRDAHVVPNSFNAAQLSLSEAILASPSSCDGKIRICYFSGSNTHGRDFQQCASALQALMYRHPNIIFRLVGMLDLDESWVPFAERIERRGFMPALDMLQNMAECTINIAPLEEGDVFCEGKSELKFFEAALVELPTVASRTGPFKAAIEDGVTGYLASSMSEWEDKLDTLVCFAELRARMGKAARKHTLQTFSAETAARKAISAYGLSAPIPRGAHHSTDRLKIGWIVPGLIVGGGGHRNILRAAYHLEQFGHDVRLYFSDTSLSDTELRHAVREHFYPFEGRVRRFTGQANGEDVLMATHWSTVGLAESVRASVGQIFYFVQDFEPAFYPMGSEYILAENTYRRNLYAITSGPWCAQILRRDYGMEADSFQFPVDKGVYNLAAGKGQPRSKRLIFFAKPEMHRRCFEIGGMALRHFHHLRPDYEILFFGSNGAKDHQQDYPVTYLDVVPTLKDLAQLYVTSTAGLAFSTTNPSLVPYEMMACGLPVIDLDRPGNEVNYDNRRDIALLADADPLRMARAIADLLDDPAELAARSAAGLKFVSTFPSEREMAERVEQLLIGRLKKLSVRQPSSYSISNSN
ncbi:glycosyltransferase family 4 protein [Sphingobium sp. CFD-2]|uniref:glycosyltransferase family 4 protein n=1 Tax=Sphingobium sp. CFD-2 TaxID=2878542 RepID=UPI00214B5966|nr:glycosyltransferase family 4 protein [Sphingobium sp. CFD-2]